VRPTRLISKYGEDAKKNDTNIRVFIDDMSSSIHQKFPSLSFYTGIRICEILVKDVISPTDMITLNNRHYRVLKTDEVRVKGKTEYCDVILFEDDFRHSITIHKQQLLQSGLNLPSVTDGAIVSLSARVETASRDELLQYTGRSGVVATHTFTILYKDFNLQVEDVIKMGSRSFEVLGFENVDEQNRLLVISAIEIINV